MYRGGHEPAAVFKDFNDIKDFKRLNANRIKKKGAVGSLTWIVEI